MLTMQWVWNLNRESIHRHKDTIKTALIKQPIMDILCVKINKINDLPPQLVEL